MTTPDPRLAAVVHERFHCNPWWTTPTHTEPDDDKQAWLRLKELAGVADVDDLTSVLPDQNIA